MTPAKRGDLLLVEESRSWTGANFQSGGSSTFRLVTVIGISRDGRARKVKRFGCSNATYGVTGRCWVIDAAGNDVAAASAAMRARIAEDWQADCFDSFEAARAFLTPFRKLSTGVS